MTVHAPSPHWVASNVRTALLEDLGEVPDSSAGAGADRDLTATLIGADQKARARVICREPCVVCGRPWVDETLRQVDPSLVIDWQCRDGDEVAAGSKLFVVEGSARTLLTAERTALNFLQLLSATATITRRYADALAGTSTRVLDTRKTIPGLRVAQKYAVACGGGVNHRMGLFDAFLIKENHIAAAGSITAAVQRAASEQTGALIEVEVETMAQLDEAIEAGAQRVMLDNFSIEQTAAAVRRAAGRVELEASGGIELDTLSQIAETGVDFVSIGALTKHVRAIDLSMRFESAPG